MSHNSRYYAKRITKKEASKCRTLDSFFGVKQVTVPAPGPDTASVSDTDSTIIISNTTSTTDTVTEPEESSTSSPITITDSASLSGSDKVEITPTPDIEIDPPTPRPSPCAQPLVSLVPNSKSNETLSSTASANGSDDDDDDDDETLSMVPDARQFCSFKYEQKYNWMYYSVVKGGYICKYCELFGQGCDQEAKFVGEGVKLGTHPSRKLEKHANSKKHTWSVDRYAQFNSKVNVLQLIQKKSLDQKEQNREVIKKLFRCLYFLVRQKWAITETFEPFVRFVAELGVGDLMRHLNSDDVNRVSYLSSKSVTQMLANLSQVIEDQLLKSLRGKKFSLLADESTDTANRSQLSIFCRWNNNGIVGDHYMGLVHLERARAEDILQAIETFFTAKGVSLTDMRFMGFDGCNTMSGEQKGE